MRRSLGGTILLVAHRAYDQVDAQGFIKLNALRLRLGAMAGRRGGAL